MNAETYHNVYNNKLSCGDEQLLLSYFNYEFQECYNNKSIRMVIIKGKEEIIPVLRNSSSHVTKDKKIKQITKSNFND